MRFEEIDDRDGLVPDNDFIEDDDDDESVVEEDDDWLDLSGLDPNGDDYLDLDD